MHHSLVLPVLCGLSVLPAAAQLTLVQSTPAEIGSSMTLQITGASPGAPLYLHAAAPLASGPLRAGTPPLGPLPLGLRYLGLANGSGVLTVGIPIPALPALLGLVPRMRALDLGLLPAPGLSNRLAAWIGPHPLAISPAPELSGGYGYSVAIGDFLGTSALDVAVGAVLETVAGAFGAGRVHVYEGPAFTSVTTLTSPLPQIGGDFGWSLAALDFDGDGATDLAVGEPGHDGVFPLANIGVVNVFYHPAGSGGVTAFGDPTPVANEQMGIALAAAQLDLTPNDELVVGASFNGAVQPAGVFATVKLLAYSGGSATVSEVSEPNASGGGFGQSVAAGDVDADGFDEILVGEPNHDVMSATDVGAAHLIDGGAVTLSFTDDAPAFGEKLGTSVAIGDADGDGLGDLLVGVLLENVAQLYLAPAFDSTNPSVLVPAHPGDIHGGRAVGFADVNGDGDLDALLAAGSCAVPGPGVVCGSLTAYLGPGLMATTYLADDAILPWSLASGDLDGDGRAEVVVGDFGASPGFVSGAGRILRSE